MGDYPIYVATATASVTLQLLAIFYFGFLGFLALAAVCFIAYIGYWLLSGQLRAMVTGYPNRDDVLDPDVLSAPPPQPSIEPRWQRVRRCLFSYERTAIWLARNIHPWLLFGHDEDILGSGHARAIIAAHRASSLGLKPGTAWTVLFDTHEQARDRLGDILVACVQQGVGDLSLNLVFEYRPEYLGSAFARIATEFPLGPSLMSGLPIPARQMLRSIPLTEEEAEAIASHPEFMHFVGENPSTPEHIRSFVAMAL